MVDFTLLHINYIDITSQPTSSLIVFFECLNQSFTELRDVTFDQIMDGATSSKLGALQKNPIYYAHHFI